MIIGGIGVAVAVIQVCIQFHLNVVHNQGVHYTLEIGESSVYYAEFCGKC